MAAVELVQVVVMMENQEGAAPPFSSAESTLLLRVAEDAEIGRGRVVVRPRFPTVLFNPSHIKGIMMDALALCQQA